jgi:hypothetical protein
MAVTLATLITLVRERADMESTTFVTDSMLTSWLNQAQEEAYDRVAAAFQDHWWTTHDYTVTGGTEALSQFSIATENPRLIRWMEWSPGTTNRQMVRRWDIGNKDDFDGLRYRLLGSYIQIEPYEYAAGTYRLSYIPNPTAMTSSGTPVDLDPKLEMFSEYLVVNAAIKARTREESDCTELRIDLERIQKRIDKMANFRDASEAPRVNDVERQAYGNAWPWYR